MSFKLGDRIYKEILYGYAEDLKNGIPQYVLTNLSEATIEITAEATDFNGKNGELVKKVWKAKNGTLNATNAFVSMNVINAAAGGEAEFATSDNKLQFPKIMSVKKGADVVLKDYVDGTVKVMQRFGNGSIGKIYTLGEAADTDKFAIDSSTKKLSLPTDPEAEMFTIKYVRELDNGSIITNRSNVFPKSVKLLLKATYFDPCAKDEIKADYIELPSFQVSPEVSFPIGGDSATMDFTGDLETDYCGADRVLYRVYSADEIDED